MIHNYSVLDNQKSSKNTFHATKFKVEENSRTFQGIAQKFKDFSRKIEFKVFLRTSPKIQELFKNGNQGTKSIKFGSEQQK